MIIPRTTRLYLLDFFRRWWWFWPLALLWSGCLGAAMNEDGSLFSAYFLPALILSNIAIWEDKHIGRLKILRMFPVSEKQLARDQWLKGAVILPLIIVIGFLSGAFLNTLFCGFPSHSSSIWYWTALVFLVSVAIMSWSHLFYGFWTNSSKDGPLLNIFWTIAFVVILCAIVFVPDRLHATPEETLGIMFAIAGAMSGAHYGFSRAILRRSYRNTKLDAAKTAKKRSKDLLAQKRSEFDLSSPARTSLAMGFALIAILFTMQIVINLIASVRPFWKIQEDLFGPLLIVNALLVMQFPMLHWMSAIRAFGSLPLTPREKANLISGIPFMTALPALILTLIVNPLDELKGNAFVWYAGAYLLICSLVLMAACLYLKWGYRWAAGGLMALFVALPILAILIAHAFRDSSGALHWAPFMTLAIGSALFLAIHSWLQRMFGRSSAPYQTKDLPWTMAPQQ